MPSQKLINFLLWNIHNNNNIESKLIKLIKEYDADIIVLIESKLNIIKFIINLNKQLDSNFYLSNSSIDNHRIIVISKFTKPELTSTQDVNEKITFRKLNIKGYKEITIGFVHLTSKLYANNITQAYEAIRYSNYILNEEAFSKHERTILLGDFNMNPFEDGIMSAMAFNAVMSKEIAKKGNRIFQGQKYKYFYNPMWHFFGDIDKTPLGTYFYNTPEHTNYSWNIFDQVLIRPELIDCIRYDKLRIIDSDGEVSLLKNGLPDKDSASDHLPILFTIDLGEIK